MTTINIPWTKGDTVSNWDEVCAWAIENFGLPGDRYMTRCSEHSMDFIFNDEKDAVFFALGCVK
jgi:hypothetical protein